MHRLLSASSIACRTPFLKLEGHTKGVLACDWSGTFKAVVSGGADKAVCVWNPFSGKRQAALTGHAATVTDVVVNDGDRQIISLGAVRTCCPTTICLRVPDLHLNLRNTVLLDTGVCRTCTSADGLTGAVRMQDKTVKVWDIRTFRCLQTLADREAYKPDDTITGLLYDAARGHVVTGNTRLKAWRLEAVEASGVGAHGYPVSQVVYNRVFEDAVSADRAGTVCVWNTRTGALRFRCAAPLTSCACQACMAADA